MAKRTKKLYIVYYRPAGAEGTIYLGTGKDVEEVKQIIWDFETHDRHFFQAKIIGLEKEEDMNIFTYPKFMEFIESMDTIEKIMEKLPMIEIRTKELLI